MILGKGTQVQQYFQLTPTTRIVSRRAFYTDSWTSDHNIRSICRDSNGRIYVSYGSRPATYWKANIGWSDDLGETWTFEEVPGQLEVNNNRPVCATDSNNNLIVVWTASPQLWYQRKLANGQWEAPIVVANAGTHGCVAIDGNDTAHIVWKETVSSRDDLRYNTVSATGLLGTRVDVTNFGFTTRQVSPVISVSPDNTAHIVWQGNGWGVNPAYYNIQYITIANNILGSRVPITDKAAVCSNPYIVVDSIGNAHIAWSDQASGFCYVNSVDFLPIVLNSYSGHSGISLSLDEAGNIFAFLQEPISPQGTLKIYANRGSGWVEEYSIPMSYQSNDIYTMHSWYPRLGGVSPNILQNGWIAYAFWPYDDYYAYLMLEAGLWK